MPHIEPFEAHADRYDAWFDDHPTAFAAEVRALRTLMPEEGRRVEIGVGTGRFAEALGIDEGIDPSSAMRARAASRGVDVRDGVAESLPYEDASLDAVLLVTTICFLDNVAHALAEAYRVLRPGGALVVGIVDREHPLGQQYKKRKHASIFYQAAQFFTTREVVAALRTAGFQGFAFRQTLTEWPVPDGTTPTVENGYGTGAFVALRARKPIPAPKAPAMPPEGPDTVRREIRHNRLTGRDVVIAPSRSSRPKETDAGLDRGGERDPSSCPFCVGNDHMLPYIIDEYPSPHGTQWQTRVVPNKFAALDGNAPSPASHPTFFAGRHAHGRQEVIIETPDHDADLPDFSEEALDTVLATYQARYRALWAEDAGLMPFVFRNYGGQAGASIHHAHSQMIATRTAPPAIEAEHHRAHIYYRATGQCMVCEMMDREEAASVRVVDASKHHLAIIPFAAEVPFEVLILPRQHAPNVLDMAAEARRDLAHILRRVLRSVRTYCADPPYNYFFRTALHHEAHDTPHLHWYLRLMPRTKQEAGFELSTDLRINPSSPEADAAGLRSTLEADTA